LKTKLFSAAYDTVYIFLLLPAPPIQLKTHSAAYKCFFDI